MERGIWCIAIEGRYSNVDIVPTPRFSSHVWVDLKIQRACHISNADSHLNGLTSSELILLWKIRLFLLCLSSELHRVGSTRSHCWYKTNEHELPFSFQITTFPIFVIRAMINWSRPSKTIIAIAALFITTTTLCILLFSPDFISWLSIWLKLTFFFFRFTFTTLLSHTISSQSLGTGQELKETAGFDSSYRGESHDPLNLARR